MVTHVNYRDASVLDMKEMNDCAHEYGVLTIWDLSHNVGIVPDDLEASGADFAVGCTYRRRIYLRLPRARSSTPICESNVYFVK